MLFIQLFKNKKFNYLKITYNYWLSISLEELISYANQIINPQIAKTHKLGRIEPSIKELAIEKIIPISPIIIKKYFIIFM